MKLKWHCALAFVAILACNELIELGKASFFDSIMRPFSAVASKARHLKDRAFSSKRQERNDRLQGRSAGPVAAGDVAGRRVSNSRPTGSPNNSSRGDFESRCFLSRGPNFKKPPKLYLYSKRTHGPDTLGCATDKTVQFELKPVDGDISDSPELDRALIRSQMLDMQLFNPRAPTYFVVHGFMASWNGDNWMCTIKDLLLNSTEANVFIVDWSGGAKPMLPIDYSASVSNTQYVGALLGEFINSLVEMSGQNDASRYHMIGHSLGAHICGYAGYYVNTLGRITGLDPAGPCFGSDSEAGQLGASSNGFLSGHRRRLSPESADFVVALHTDIGLFGLKENCAHYDVFVNGGFKQPKCASSSLANRFEDLISLNLKDAVALDLTCAHSYAHEIIDTFIKFLRNGASQSGGAILVNQIRDGGEKKKVANLERCFPMAYECANWHAFKAGECGFCSDNDPRCLFTGLSLYQFQAKKTIDVQYKGSRLSSKEDDDDYNDEDADLGNDDPDGNKPDRRSLDRFAQGQHFMRSGSLPETCLFQYQVVVATRSRDIEAIENEGKYYFYLHLPLELSGRLLDSKAERLHDRLVQVSHKVQSDSTAFQLLHSNYMKTLAAKGAITPLDDQSDDVDFYTALITFRQVPADDCKHDPTNGASRKDYWQLCKPVNSINEARLWSSSEQKLNSVLWVGLNYMSGLNEELRFKNSYVMKRPQGEQVKARDQLEKANRADLDNMEPEQNNSFGNVLGEAKNTAGCLLSLFDGRSSSEPKYNFRCGRSASELKFAVKLAPKRLA